MAVQLSRELMRSLGELRYEPTPKRLRARAGELTLVDSERGVLVWEPKRVVPSYAVPEEDIQARVVPAVGVEAAEHPVAITAGGPPVLDPRTGFAAHTCEGEPLSLEAPGVLLEGAGFRPAGLDGYIALDFDAFEWLEEDEPIVSHPRDPFHRIDIRRTSRAVRIEVEGVPVAETSSARMLFETNLPPRFYLPREDVRLNLLTPSVKSTACAYKGHASYWSVEVNGHVHPDLAWGYEQPLSDAADVAGHIAFFDEHVDVIVDGRRRPRPVSPWS
ncbi:DUF427 domain-containing protein [Actinocrispum sp. NPDC049592]|uniref:DUF427 domain-containing protein n=1 Tax=Actinocrispum sp. NPDC049592 TaxID=3154835 RepID=UPI0034227B70